MHTRPSSRPRRRLLPLRILLSLGLMSALLGAQPHLARADTTVGAGTYQNTSSAITYTGTWGSTASSSDSGGSIATLTSAGSAQLTFGETRITWVARKAPSFGIANVYLDGTQVATVDLYAPSNVFQANVYTSPELAEGTHVLRVERSGNKNDASTGRGIDVDSLVVPDSHAPATPTGLAAVAEGSGGRLSWDANPESDVAGYRIYRATGTSTTYTALNSTPLDATTYLDPALTPGAGYRYQISAVDLAGNASSRTADRSLTASASAVGAGTYENTSSAISYSGSWGSTSSANDSGGSIATLASTGYAQLAFEETGVTWVARKAASFGIANVYLDGTQVATVDLYAPGNVFRSSAYTVSGLSSGTHTLRIERSGNKNDASSGRGIDLDSLVVLDSHAPSTPTGLSVVAEGSGGRLRWSANAEDDVAGYRIFRATGSSTSYTSLSSTPVNATTYLDPALTPGTTYRYQIAAVDGSGNTSARTADKSFTTTTSAVGAGTYENTSSAITYVGTWGSTSSSSDSGGSIATLTSTGYAGLAFEETSVRWVARTGNFYGIANVFLDGTQVATVDLYAPGNVFKSAVYTSPTLSYGQHTIRIERSGNKNDASSGRGIDLDSLVVADTLIPGTPTGFTAVAAGSGAQLAWSANREADLAGYRVYRATGDSTSYTTLATTPSGTTSYTDPALTPGTTYRYQIAAVDTSGNVSPRTADRSVTTASTEVGAGTYENPSSAITYVGSWTVSESASDSGGSIAALATPGYAQIAFQEAAIKYIARKSPSFGIANIYLDGVLVSTADLYAPSNLHKATVYTSPDLSYGTHTLRVERSGNKNDASVGRSIDIDSFLVPDTRAPSTPTGLDATTAGSGARLSWDANTESDIAGYRISRAQGSSTTFTPLTAEPLDATSYLDRSLTPNTTYRYRITALDLTGHESDPTAPVSVTSAVTSGTYENDNDAVKLVGPWVSSSEPGASGGSIDTVRAAGTAGLTFFETGVRWIGSTSPSGGIASVYLDGDLVTSVDQYSATTVHGVKLYEAKGLPVGSHTLRVTWTSGRNAATSGSVGETVVDAFVVVDTIAPDSPEAVWANASGAGVQVEWTPSTAEDAVGYLVYRAKGSSTSFTRITPESLPDPELFDDNLEPGAAYTYRVTAVDAAGNESPVSMDARATAAVSTGTLENTSSAVVYSTPWTIASSTRDSGGSSSNLTVPGNAELDFSGTGIKWVTRTNNYSGIAQVYVDDVAVKSVDLYAATQAYQQVVFSDLDLTDGTHSIRIERTGTKNAASTGRGISLDAFIVLDSTAPPTMAAPVLSMTRMGISVAWSASTAADVAAYRLYRGVEGEPDTVLDRLPLSDVSFLDVGLADSTTYTYRITAIDTSGNESAASPSSLLRTPPAPPPVAERYVNCPAATRTVSTTGTLQNALNQAQPGDVIRLAPGIYSGYFTLTTKATAAAPVWVCGPREAILDFGDVSAGSAMFINGASYVTVTGMTIRGVQKGVTVAGGSHVTVSDIKLDNIGDEAIHLRTSTTDSVVIGNTIHDTGRLTPGFGEGVYVGSDPDNWCTYSACNPDRSDRNSILDNDISGTTAEGIEAKAGTTGGLVQGNRIDGTSMTAANSGGWVVVKGSSWLVKGNIGVAAPEHGFQATLSKVKDWGRNNVFVANSATVGNPTGFGVWVQKGIGNLIGCDNTTPDGTRAFNVSCQR